MRVLCLGYSRTCTLDLSIALETLGYRTYHLAEVSQNPTHFPCWKQAQEAKFFGDGKAWSKTEFDKVLGRHDVRSDSRRKRVQQLILTCAIGATLMLTAYNRPYSTFHALIFPRS